MGEGGMDGSSDAVSQPPGASAAAGSRTVFLSYASPDAQVANQVCQFLESHGVPCWMAPRDVKPGAAYADAIVRAINEASALVLVLSGAAMASEHVSREVERAGSKHKPIVAFRVDAAALSAELEYFLSRSQWIDVLALGMLAALVKLVEAVGLGSAAAHATLGFGGTASGRSSIRQAVGTASVAKRVVVAAAVVIVVAVSGVLAVRFWQSKRGVAAAPVVAAISDKSIAVLPFTDMSEKKDQEYFADGMAEELGEVLARIPGLKVIGRTSSFQYKGKNDDLRTIGTRLHAAYVVEGSVRKAGARVRVTAQLVEAESGTNQWSATYDRDFGDVLALQDEIATRIARALQLAVDADTSGPMRHVQNTEAYNLYLHGRALQDQLHIAQLLEAARDFEQALVLDPSFLRAAEALAWTYVAQGYDEDVLSRDAWKSAREAAQRALRIDSNSAAAHGVLGVVYALGEYDWEAAATEFSKGLALNPRDTVTLGYAAIVAQSRGKYVEAQRLFSASLALDPLNPFTLYSIGDMYYKMGNLADSESAFRRCLASNATFDGGHFMIGRIHLVRREIEAAQTEFQADVAADAKDAGLSMYYHATGKNPESDAALAKLIKASGDTWPYIVAIVHAYRGERKEAFDWLEKAYATRDSDFLASVRADPELEPLRADSRYKAFLKKMNLPE